MTSANSTPTPPPTRPRITLRVAFAGNRHLPEELAPFRALLDQALGGVAARLLVHGQAAADGCGEFPLRRFYATEAPLLRLITGLAEGADAEAGEALLRMQVAGVEGRLAAPSRRSRRPIHDFSNFNHE